MRSICILLVVSYLALYVNLIVGGPNELVRQASNFFNEGILKNLERPVQFLCKGEMCCQSNLVCCYNGEFCCDRNLTDSIEDLTFRCKPGIKIEIDDQNEEEIESLT